MASSGPSGSFGGSGSVTVVTNASGRATAPAFTANTIAGRYTVMAQATGGRNPSAIFNLTNVPAAATSFSLTDLPPSLVAGTVIAFTITARDPFNNIATGYTGTVHFSSTDPNATLPADYTFRPHDHGVHTVTGLSLQTAGLRYVIAADAADARVVGISPGVRVLAAAAVTFQVLAPATVTSGTPFDVTVIAVDAYGNTDTNYQGTVTFTTLDGDPSVVLPPDYTFQPSDADLVTFPGGVTLITPGDQALSVTDTSSGITGNVVVTVTAGGARGRRTWIGLAEAMGLPHRRRTRPPSAAVSETDPFG